MTDPLNDLHSLKSLNTRREAGRGAGASASEEGFALDMTYSSCIIVKRRQRLSWLKIVLLGTLPTNTKWG
jgi:hypothetical protein